MPQKPTFRYVLVRVVFAPALFARSQHFEQHPFHHSKVDTPACDCTGTTPTKSSNASHYYVCGDDRLGPRVLPWRLPLLSLVSNYDRFGGLTPGEFLKTWKDPATGWWKYPPQGGFLLNADGRPINGTAVLRKGAKVDRFGDETGRFLGSADAPFAQRAIPPDALNVCPPPKRSPAASLADYGESGSRSEAEGGVEAADGECKPKDHPWNYHAYEVLEDLVVSAGPIAPAFGQPGLGVQFYLGPDKRVSDLLREKRLKPLTLSAIHNGPEAATSCGRNPVNCDCQPPKAVTGRIEL